MPARTPSATALLSAGRATGPAGPRPPGSPARRNRSRSLAGDEAVVVAQRAQARLGRLGSIARRERPHAQAVLLLAAHGSLFNEGVGDAGLMPLGAPRLGIGLAAIGSDLQYEIALGGGRGRRLGRGLAAGRPAFEQGQGARAVVVALRLGRWLLRRRLGGRRGVGFGTLGLGRGRRLRRRRGDVGRRGWLARRLSGGRLGLRNGIGRAGFG